MANKPKWGEETFRRVYEMDKAIQLPDNRENYRDIYDGMTYEQTWEYSPAAKLDERFPFPLQIAGSEFEIRLQASFGKWLHDVLGRRLGYLVRFEDFWEQWSEKGFSWTINRTGTPDVSTNYPLRDTQKPDGTEVRGWRIERDTRPAYLEWKNPKPSTNPYYRIIEYWPDRSDANTSYVLIGSDSEIIRHIVAIQYSGGGQTEARTNYSRTSLNRGDFPLIEIWFREINDNFAFGKQEYRWRLRLLGKTFTENPSVQNWVKTSPLTEAEITQISRKIISVFGVERPSISDRFIFQRGKKLFVYKDKNGLFNKGFCLNESEAKKLIGAFCQVMSVEPDWKCLDVKKNAEESQFSNNSEKIKIMNKEVDKPIRRPENRIVFWEAVMAIPGFPTFPIANLHGHIFKEMPDPKDFLHKLQS